MQQAAYHERIRDMLVANLRIRLRLILMLPVSKLSRMSVMIWTFSSRSWFAIMSFMLLTLVLSPNGVESVEKLESACRFKVGEAVEEELATGDSTVLSLPDDK